MSIPRVVSATTRTDPVGECIYCGAREALSDEHVVPFGLGGHLVLPDASCPKCARITSAVEGRVLRGFMLDARSAGSFPTRHPNKRPTAITVEARRGDCLEQTHVLASEATGVLELPTFGRAGFLSGEAATTGVRIVGVETLGFGKPMHEFMLSLETVHIRTVTTVDAMSLARMLAKIGFAYAVAEQGIFPRVECPVLPLILGCADVASYWVGSATYQLSPVTEKAQIALGLIETRTARAGREEKVLVARIKLFADAGATGYEVIVRRTPG